MKYKARKLTDEEIEILAGHKPIKAKTLKKKLEDVDKMKTILGLLKDYPEAINKDRVIEMLETNIKYYKR